MTRETATIRALWAALFANLTAPIGVADRLTRRALAMVKGIM